MRVVSRDVGRVKRFGDGDIALYGVNPFGLEGLEVLVEDFVVLAADERKGVGQRREPLADDFLGFGDGGLGSEQRVEDQGTVVDLEVNGSRIRSGILGSAQGDVFGDGLYEIPSAPIAVRRSA